MTFVCTMLLNNLVYKTWQRTHCFSETNTWPPVSLSVTALNKCREVMTSILIMEEQRSRNQKFRLPDKVLNQTAEEFHNLDIKRNEIRITRSHDKKVFIVYKYIYSYINSNTNMSKITSDRFHFVFLGEVNAS